MEKATDDLELLLIEDNPSDVYLIKEMLRSSPLRIKNIYETDRVEAANKILKDGNIHLALLDLSLSDSHGILSFLNLKKAAEKIPVIILTGFSDTKTALEAIKEGAQDYLIKGEFDSGSLTKAIQYSFERIQYVTTLQRLNERLLFHIENAPLGFIEWDNNLKVKSWSRRAEEIFGWTEKEFNESDKTGYSQVYEEDQSRVFKISEQLLSGAIQRNSVQHRNYTKDGRLIWCEWFNSVLKDNDGKVVSIMSLVRDITEQKEVEKIIHESEEKYRQIVETAQEGIWLIDENNRVSFVNKKMAEILDYSEEEIIGRPVFDFIIDSEKEFAANEIEHQKKEEGGSREFRFITKSGKYIWTNVSSNSIFDNEGKYKGALAMVTDVSLRKRLQTELEEQQRLRQVQITAAVLEAQEKERIAIGEELHDNINQILSSVKMYIGMAIKSPQKSDEFLPKCTAYISLAIEENRKLAKELILPQLKGVGLSESLKELTDETRLTSRFNVILEIKDINETIFNEQQKVSLYRIVQEQLNNIVKYADAKSATIQLYKEENKIILIVSDNGKGFDTSIRSKGVGFTNISSRAEVLHGKAEIESAPGKGCTLKVIMELE